LTTPPLTEVRLKNTARLVPSRYPVTGILDVVATPEDLPFVFELESWSNDRVSTELGILHRIPQEEWVVGRPMASVIMAAFCHPKPAGGRFNSAERGAWYAGTDLDTAHAEIVHHRTKELSEVGVYETFVHMRLYLADFHAAFHDVRARTEKNREYHDRGSYASSQALARDLLAQGSNGILYRSVRRHGGECLACFRPRLIQNVRASHHYEYRWHGTQTPVMRKL